MSWERDPLWAKARLFFERAFAEPREHPSFGLWCSLGLELLARAAVASISPTLLAEPDREQKNLLHALNRGSEKIPRKSIAATQVLKLCSTLFPQFTKEDYEVSLALIQRRNDELHSGAAAFEEYPQGQWLRGFYSACKSLTNAMGESLERLFGPEEAKAANDVLQESLEEVKREVLKSVALHKRDFGAKPVEEQGVLRRKAEDAGALLSTQRHHRVTCPACGAVATVQGSAVGKANVEHVEDTIVVRQSIAPTSFSCSACGLKMQGYGQLTAAGLSDPYARRTTYSPEEYYGLVAPEQMEEADEPDELPGREYDNE